MNVKADSLKNRAELLRENEQLRTAKRGRDTLAQVQAASRNRATHHEYERMLQAKVEQLQKQLEAALETSSANWVRSAEMFQERTELEAQVAALSAPVRAGEWHVSCRIAGVVSFTDIASALIAARVSKLKENSNEGS